MIDTTPVNTVKSPSRGGHRLFRYYWERLEQNKLSLVGLGFIIFLTLVGIFGPLLTQDPQKADFEIANLPPLGASIEQSVYDIKTGTFETKTIYGQADHPLGTDSKGRDMLAMLFSGARISLLVGLLASGIAIFIGTLLGVLSAYMGGWVDNVLMRFTDIMMTFPFFLLLVLIVFIFGPSLAIIVVVIGLTGWTGAARLIRSEALSLRTRDFITASKALGASDARVVFNHMIPNVISLVIVMATLSIPGVIMAEASLSFIGLGDPMSTSWGTVLNAGQHTMDTAWWVAVEPGLMLFFTVLSFNFFGDGLRDAFDPKASM
ncbi:MAG: ABC transporter permease [Dehalococcoidia bacterium]|nr:ABC transporter permease [Dehalococcoidia bacterium]